MAVTRVNHIDLVERDGIRHVRVVRHRTADAPMRIANAIMRRRSVPVQMLELEAWASREAEMAQLSGGSARVCGRAIERPWSRGTTLGLMLQQPSSVLASKLAACEAASRALRRLHTGDRGRTSHGDATVWNVAYDEATDRASWFDFDLAHDDSSPPVARQADDLRALAYSAAVVVDDAHLFEVLQCVAEGYGDRMTWDELARLNREDLSGDPVHLAQSWGCRRRRERCHDMVATLDTLILVHSGSPVR